MELAFKVIFVVLYVIAGIGRLPFALKSKRTKVIVSKKSLQQRILLFFSSFMMIIPLFYVFTDWINYFNMNLNYFVRVIGVFGFAFAVFLHNWTHVALSANWSPVLEIKKGHKLITTGPYKYVRHPMYTAFWLWALFQGILLSNWLVLSVGVISFGLVYFFRIKAEEQMMLQHFGKNYKEYMKRTGRLFPRLG